MRSIRASGPRRGLTERGFTLLEVLIALAIAIPAVILLFRMGVDSITAVHTSELYESAVSRANSRLATLTDQALAPGERSGSDGDGFLWHTVIAPVASTPPPRQPPRNSRYAAGTTLFAITVEVSWQVGSGRRSVSLASRRLGPTPATGP